MTSNGLAANNLSNLPASNVAGKRILITGGASGIGAASAKLLASRGAKVVIGDRNEELGDSVYKEALEANHSITFRRVDVTDGDDVRALFKFAMSELATLGAKGCYA